MEKSASAMSAGASGPAGPPPPSAPPPPPSAPPSYEEAVGSMGAQSTIPPYPTGPSSMPVSYGPVGITAPDLTDAPPNPYTTQPQVRTEVRVVRHPVPYALGPTAVKMQCPTCLASIKTSTITQRQPSAHLCCMILCVLGCCLCSCLPYCMSAFTTVHHYCPSCTVYIGTWKG